MKMPIFRTRKRNKVAFYVKATHAVKGGIERLVAQVANHLVAHGTDVVIFADTLPGDSFPFDLAPEVDLVCYKFSNEIKFIQKLRADITTKGINCIFVMRSGGWSHLQLSQAVHGLDVELVFSEHAAPEIAETEYPRPGMRSMVMENANSIHLLQDSYVPSLPQHLQSKAHVIPNSIVVKAEDAELPAQRSRRTGRKRICMVGRLTPTQKRPRLLLKAFNLLHKNHPDWDLYFYGEGETERKILEEFIQTHDLGDRVFLMGQVENVGQELEHCDIFCLPSAYEGMSIAMLEAMAKALPCVAFQDAPGLGAFIKSGHTGELAKGHNSFYQLSYALARLMQNDALREQQGRNAYAFAAEHTEDKILARWDDYIKTLCAADKPAALPRYSDEELDTAIAQYYVKNDRLVSFRSGDRVRGASAMDAPQDSTLPTRVLLYCHGQSPGGVERLYSLIIPHLMARGLDITVLCSAMGNSFPFALDPAVKVMNVDIKNTFNLTKIISRLDPDVLYVPRSSDADHMYFIDALACLGGEHPIICSEHIPPQISKFTFKSEFRRRFIHSCADGVHLLLPDYNSSTPKWIQSKIHNIENPIVFEPSGEPRKNTATKTIVTMGRLSFEKGVNNLIRAFHQLQEEFPDWEVHIYGDGPRRDELNSFIQYYGLQESVRIFSHTDQVNTVLENADLYVCPSYWEGFGLAVGEALAAGVPALGFEQARGIKALIRDGENGLLITGDPEAGNLAQGLRRLMADDQLRLKLSAGARNTAEQFPRIEDIAQKWHTMFVETAQRKGNTSIKTLLGATVENSNAKIAQFLAKNTDLVSNDLLPKYMCFNGPENRHAPPKNGALEKLVAYKDNPASKELLARMMKSPFFSVLFEFNALQTEQYFATLKSIFSIETLHFSNGLSTMDPDLVDAVFIMIPHPRPLREKVIEWAQKHRKPLFVLEAGFVSSIGLMQERESPISFNVDFDSSSYLQADHESSISKFLNSPQELDPEQKKSAGNFADLIIQNDISKYNNATKPMQANVSDYVLVIDQSYNDWSIVAAGAQVETFDRMLDEAIAENPDRKILVRIHPDALSGMRKGNITVERYLDHPNVVIDASGSLLGPVLAAANKVYVVSSTVGFEALIRGKEVICYGQPFYAGWGLTTDRGTTTNRRRTRSLDDLIYAAYLNFTYYLDVTSDKPAEPVAALEVFCSAVASYRRDPVLWQYMNSNLKRRINLLENKLGQQLFK